MEIIDRIYGAHRIEEPVLLDLLQTRAVQRLKGVLQHGVSALVGITNSTSRYEHSLGVMLLVRRLGASVEEQIAALLHDVSHTAFSHVIDYVFGGYDVQSYHDEIKETYAAGTDIPAVLESHQRDWCDYVCLSDEEQAQRYSLLEQPAPALCADRLDYFLRDSIDLGLANMEEIQDALDHLIVFQGKIATDSVQTARWLGYTYLAADRASWANFREVGLYELAAMAIRRGLEIGVLSEKDLWGTDLPAWEKLHASPDPELKASLELVSADTRFERDEQHPTFWVGAKLRTIDPPVLLDGQMQQLSELDSGFRAERLTYLNANGGKWPMRVIPPAMT